MHSMPTMREASPSRWWTVVLAMAGAVVAQAPEPAPATEHPATEHPATEHPAAEHPATLALLVGINEYAKPAEGTGFEPLRGAENDVERARTLLIEQFGFAPESIATLIGPEATHAAIVRTFHQHLIQRAGPDTRVVFWFSGHGARIPDASGQDHAAREPGESVWDDTLVAYDSRSVAADGSYDLADDELFTLLRALRSRDVVVVTDCCHSGGALRGGPQPGVRDAGRGTKSLDTERVAKIWPEGIELPAEDGHGDLDDLPHVLHIAACAATEEAGEVSLPLGCEEDCTYYGTCTFYLSVALRSAGPQATWNAIVEQTHASAIGRGSRSQRIHVVGDGRRLVFGGRGRSTPLGYLCESFSERQLSIAAGTIHGLGVGAELDLLDHDGKHLGKAVVDRVGEVSSVASRQDRAPKRPIAMRAQPTSFGALEPTFRVHVAEGVPASLCSGVPFVGIAEPGAADVTIEPAGEQIVLRQADGRRSRPIAAKPADVRAALLREHHRRVLWNCVATPGKLDIGVEVLPATAEDVERYKTPGAERFRIDPGIARAIRGVVGVTADDPALSPEANRQNGGLIRVRAWNCSDQDLHIAIVSVAENGEVYLLHGKSEGNVVRPGQEFTKCVWLIRSADWPAEQPMLDRYVVIGTPAFADFRPFEAKDANLTRSGEKPDASMLPPLLRQAVHGTRTRGAFEPADETPDWGIAFADLLLVSPAKFETLDQR